MKFKRELVQWIRAFNADIPGSQFAVGGCPLASVPPHNDVPIAVEDSQYFVPRLLFLQNILWDKSEALREKYPRKYH